MADSNIVLPGTSEPVDTYTVTGGDKQQVVRLAKATGKTNDSWPIVTAGEATVIAADASRVCVLMVNNGSGRVYLRYDSTIPTTVTAEVFLEAGDRYEVPEPLVTLAISMMGQFAGGVVYSTLFTAA